MVHLKKNVNKYGEFFQKRKKPDGEIPNLMNFARNFSKKKIGEFVKDLTASGSIVVVAILMILKAFGIPF